MIAQLTGRLLAKGQDYLVVEVAGVGFKVYVPTPLLDRAAPPRLSDHASHAPSREGE